MQRFARVAFHGKVSRQPVSHFAIGLGRGQGVVLEQRCGAVPRAGLHVANGQRRNGDAQRGIVGDHALQYCHGRVQIAHPHLLITGGSAQQRMARLQRQAFFQLVAGQLDLILIVIDSCAMVVEDRGVGRVQLERAHELVQRFFVHAVSAQRNSGHHVHVPIVGRAGQQAGNAVPRRLLLAARKQHIDTIEIRFGRCRIELQRLVECTARAHYVNLPAKSVTRVLQFGDAQPGPSRCKCRIGRGDAREQRVRAIQIGARTGAHHERAEQRLRLQILFAHRPRQRAVSLGSACRAGSRSALHGFDAFGGAHALKRGEDLVRNFRLHCDQVQRGHANRPARAHTLRGHVEKLPAQVESVFRAYEASCQHELHKQFLPHGQGIELRDGQLHERARGPHHERRNARQPRRNGIGQRITVERSCFSSAEIGKGQNDQ